MTDKHNVGAGDRFTATPSTIISACLLVIGTKMAYTATGFARSSNFAFSVTFPLVACDLPRTRSSPIVRQANISTENERTLPDDAPTTASRSGGGLRHYGGVDDRGVR
jgi:hypothetical protein